MIDIGELDDARALVTGAAGRIGRAIAVALAEAGAHVLASDVDAAGLAATAGRLGDPHRTRVADLTSEDEITALVTAAAGHLGGLTHVVNCAATTEPGGTILESSTATLDRALAVNTRAPYLVTRAALPHLLEGGHGVFVNIASIHGLVAGAGFAPYAVSKIGLIQLTRQVAVEYGRYGIRCNAVCPGATRSQGEPADEADLQPFRAVVGRIADSGEIADAVVYLAGPRASFVNGAILPVDGGYTAH
ncbi:SDR family NAD(P)-dependent oxidoreductase [Jiangella anatolica]|uniref:SDR family NAD(P)-dependent oxidoreductase n=1 Tax=Jiangella anatolica TaxID=2670374 RepID=UPI00131400F3|nr:SDR family oxidoreductase [Jiangella anatolica]